MRHRTVIMQDRNPLDYEPFAVLKKVGPPKCPKSSFAAGYHRIGLVPTLSVLDGGSPGCVAKWFCLDCGASIQNRNPASRYCNYFVPIKQRNRLSEALKEGGGR